MDVTQVTQGPITPSGLNAPPNTSQGISTYRRTYTYMNNHTLIHVHIYINIYIYTHMHMHTYILNNLGLDSRCPTPGGVYYETAGVCNQSILLLDGLSYQTDEHHLPGATGFKAPVTRLKSPLLSVETGLPGLMTNHMRRPGVGLGCQRL